MLRVVVPARLREQVLADLHQGHPPGSSWGGRNDVINQVARLVARNRW